MANGRTRLIIAQLSEKTKGKDLASEIARALNQSETVAAYEKVNFKNASRTKGK